MNNIYDTANQLEKEIYELAEFKALKETYSEMQADEDAYGLFKEFQEFQQKLQEKQMSGEEFTEEETTKAQELATKIQATEIVDKLMQKEQALSTVINDLNRIIMTPIRNLYND
ncbi:YlbF family regulator [Melissococcus plutonius]|uniref:UPF0342 protein MPTP_0649 n=1 Tax=Melissococcus plutonius (strain ATCC 35311 / DSM 29964 / CIP 104052 / LMG 20360 / NCIMB 702443) TaxID=940190 RepID=F3Y9D9_MELPT|nr:YlbF family regulator [Melissococcus plutonius]AIM24677.1 hypothetical protein MEPL_c005670 [Melissococcus plutonius S1]KMT24779.1 hypothetical protein MEPL2_2c03140 [Melissococcus plutonius]KMT26416.1 hypothetical protein MEPL3_2c00770 [Melissococcus plutonius]KMT27666.1 hypothetical protein MEPL1_3c03070 [Melissococcus plutonius]KMT29438.1 hypothetical protein MEPL4_3c03050 [Melissococcus plutonius]